MICRTYWEKQGLSYKIYKILFCGDEGVATTNKAFQFPIRQVATLLGKQGKNPRHSRGIINARHLFLGSSCMN